MKPNIAKMTDVEFRNWAIGQERRYNRACERGEISGEVYASLLMGLIDDQLARLRAIATNLITPEGNNGRR